MRKALLAAVVVACAVGAFALAAGGSEREAAPPPERIATFVERPETELPPLPDEYEPKVVEPEAGESGAVAAVPEVPEITEQAPPTEAPKPKRAASSGNGDLARPTTAGDGIREATALPNGIALPPLEAPEPVKQMIEAGNVIARKPYLWGGGHGKWLDKGYDCSGSVSFVLASAGYLEAPLASGPLMSWGEPGPGKWVTIYSHEGHVFMVVAGIRFDTSGARETGSRWQNELRSTAGFVARHPPGL
jgi:hypothetical protein